MDEPYVIGVRLALEDGVSAGIAELAGEMKALEAALAAGLGAVRPSSGGRAAALMDVARAGARVLPVVTPPVEPTLGERAMGAREIVRGEIAERALMRPVTPEFGVAPAMRVQPPEPATQAGMRPISTVVERVIERIAGPPPELASAPAAMREPPVLAERPVAAPVVLPLAGGFRRAEPAALERGAAAADNSRPDWSAAMAPGIAAALAPVMPQAAPSGPVGGDNSSQGGPVYLDGQLLGRWMSERLAREAGRPAGGVTGFDGRMGPAWPGALQGV